MGTGELRFHNNAADAQLAQSEGDVSISMRLRRISPFDRSDVRFPERNRDGLGSKALLRGCCS